MHVGAIGDSTGPIKSMTGFGRGRSGIGEVEVVTEIRAVNHRFLDVSVKLPKAYNCFEPQVRKIVSEIIHRGKFDVMVTRVAGKSGLIEVALDEPLAAAYYGCLTGLKDKFGLSGDITVSDMLTLKDIIVPAEKEDQIEREWPLIEESLRNAIESLDQMRRAEGAALWNDIVKRLTSIRENVSLIAPLVDQVVASAKERLERRVKELSGGLDLDSDRLAQEVALIADRADVTEELTRLKSHVEQFINFFTEGSPLGRKLDFLLQEINREVNTLGSKSASTEIASHVVFMKSELEKIREQTQNIE
ncbi:MAG: YicC family protein [Desulfomonile tiedjei]|uniref:YicC family protein n=1 Tax=Desulfomonile tiedjei TaxID=2358 RepID=A0A9D6V4R4_9BACT|nr:YicC family protein [Desulfomonile tiedjei]